MTMPTMGTARLAKVLSIKESMLCAMDVQMRGEPRYEDATSSARDAEKSSLVKFKFQWRPRPPPLGRPPPREIGRRGAARARARATGMAG